jgi:hypothetical protein
MCFAEQQVPIVSLTVRNALLPLSIVTLPPSIALFTQSIGQHTAPYVSPQLTFGQLSA